VHRIKILNDPCPHFKRQASKYAHLLEMHKDMSTIKRKDRFIRYNPRYQRWYVYTLLEVPQVRGNFDNVVSAVFNALN
jgi:hypothetical protein